jgi:hypothetical protein
MSKGQLIEYIRELNPTADAQFLDQFSEEQLHQYLDHLRAGRDHRLRIGGWVRRKGEERMAG